MILTKVVNSKYRLLILLTNDFFVGVLSSFLASFIILDFHESIAFLSQNSHWILLIPILKISFFYLSKIYSISWRYASLKDIAKAFQSIFSVSLILGVGAYFSPAFNLRLSIVDFLLFTGEFSR